MKTYIVRLEIKSAVATPFHSDTIFGHLAWAIRYLKGEPFLEDWLNNFHSSPTLISDGFPLDDNETLLFPFPILKPTPPDLIEKFLSEFFGRTLSKEELIHSFDAIKMIKKRSYISQSVLQKHINNLSEINLISEFFKSTYESLTNPQKHKLSVATRFDMHNTINRLTNTVLEEGGLYSVKATYYKENSKIWIAIRSNEFDKKELENYFQHIAKNGFGKDSSVGKGALKFIDLTEIELPSAKEPNAYLSLSHFIPEKNLPVNSHYSFMVKFGKLGGAFANNMPVFKKPLIMFNPGSIIFKDNKEIDFNYQLTGNIHFDSRIKQYACVFPLPVRIVNN